MDSKQFVVEYFDQILRSKRKLSQFLPRVGQVIGDFSDNAGNGSWYLLKLNQPFHYQVEVGENLAPDATMQPTAAHNANLY